MQPSSRPPSSAGPGYGHQYGSSSDVSLGSDISGSHQHRRRGSVHLSDVGIYNIAGSQVLASIPQAPQSPPPPPPGVPVQLPPPPDDPPPAPPTYTAPNPGDYRGFSLRYQRDENIYHTIPDPGYHSGTTRSSHLYEQIKDDAVPWPDVEISKGGHGVAERRVSNPYAPEPPRRTSSLRKKNPPPLLAKPQLNSNKDKFPDVKGDGERGCRKCKAVSIAAFIILLLGAIAATVALYILGYFSTGELIGVGYMYLDHWQRYKTYLR